MNRNFKDLRPGDRVLVDTRKLFFSDHEWTEASFVRWDGHPMWKGEYVNGCVNKAIIRIDTPTRAPMLDHVEGGLYQTTTTSLRTTCLT